MLPTWTGNVVKKQHIYGISNEDIANEIGCTAAYVSMLLNAKREPKNGRKTIEDAVNALIARRQT